MDNDWHKILSTTVAFILGAAALLGVITAMFYVPELFK